MEKKKYRCGWCGKIHNDTHFDPISDVEVEKDTLETAINDFEIGDKIVEVILLGKSGAVRRVIV